MLMIRLQRIGRKHEPAFRLVLTDSKNSTKSGKFLEILGNYDARRGEKSEFKADRIIYWMSTGAQLSDTVHNLLVDKKIIAGKKINTLPKKSAPKVEVLTEEPIKAEVSSPAEEPKVEIEPVPTPDQTTVSEVSVEESTSPVASAEEVVA